MLFGNVWKWCVEFLDKNPGECLIFQIKEDDDSGAGGLMYKYFKRLASRPNSYIYSGGYGMPTLSDLRGKIYIVSRLEQNDAQWAVENDPHFPDGAAYSSDMLYSIDPFYGYTHPDASAEEVENELVKKWGYDASSYKEFSTVYDPILDEEGIYHAEYCTTINEVQLWTFDDWKNHPRDKKSEIKSGLYTNKTRTLKLIRKLAKDAGYDALCLYFTSDSGVWSDFGSNFDIAKEIQSWLFDQSWYTDEIYTAFFCHNFIDGYSAYRSWASNYKAYTGDWEYPSGDYYHTRIWRGPGDFVYCSERGSNETEKIVMVTEENPIGNLRNGTFVRATYVDYNHVPKKVLYDYEIIQLDDIEGQRFLKHSISLNGDIGVNYYIYLTLDEVNDAEITFSYTVDGTEKTSVVRMKDAEMTPYGYKVSCSVCAPEMRDSITATLSLAGHELATDYYSAWAYADFIIGTVDWIWQTEEESEYYHRLVPLLTAMLNYGGAAQVQFEDQHPNTGFANEGLNAPAALTDAELSAIDMPKPDKEAINAQLSGTGLTYYGYTMLLYSKTSLRFFFKKESKDTDISGIHLSIGTGSNKVTYNAKNYDDLYAYVEVEEIPAFELNNAYTLSVGDKDLGSYSALTYVKDVLTNDASDDALINTVTAMYRYHKEAVAYFSNYIG